MKKAIALVLMFSFVFLCVSCGPDREAPVISVSQDEFTLFVGSKESDLKSYFSATDGKDGDLSNVIEFDFSGVDFDNPGTYTFKVSVSDKAGNLAEKEAKVTIEYDNNNVATVLGNYLKENLIDENVHFLQMVYNEGQQKFIVDFYDNMLNELVGSVYEESNETIQSLYINMMNSYADNVYGSSSTNMLNTMFSELDVTKGFIIRVFDSASKSIKYYVYENGTATETLF